ncbi:MAG TPA: universal stress protein [Ktedonobacterales bacterium]|nr:universal stress protein [Ktedonobacterales bacterium]
MRVLCCLDGTNTEWLAQQALALLNAPDLRLVLLYVVDVGPGHDMERMRQRYLGLGQRGADLLAQTQEAEQEQGEEIMATAQATFREAWPGGTPRADQIERMMLRGKPEQEIVRLGAALSSDLIIICTRRVLGPGEPPHPPGPKSVGHVARFVLDHAPCPVLLLRP